MAQLVTTLARGGAQATVLGSSHDWGPGVEVTVLAGPDDPGEGTYWSDAARHGIPTRVVPRLHRPLAPRSDAAAVRWLVSWLRRVRPDVLHTHSAKAGLLGRVAASLAGVPVVHTVHGWSASSILDGRAAGARRRAIIEVERFLARRSRALVVVTSMDAEEGLRLGIGRPEQYRVIRSGISLSAPGDGVLRRAPLREQLGLSGRFVVGTVGRLADQKNMSTLLEGFAAAGLENGYLVIVGDGPRRLDLKRQAASLGLDGRVRFLGHRPDAAQLVATFDVFVSTSRWEGLPRTIIEAIAADVPVIATPVGGVPEVVQHGLTGTLVAVDDPEAVAQALRARVRHPHSFSEMAAVAAARVEEFSEERMRADLISLWRQVASRPEVGSASDRSQPSPAPPALAERS